MPASSTPVKAICFLLLYFLPLLLPAQKKDTRPNIIYIMADDMGYADLSSYGRKDYKTPNLDKLAQEGIKFTHAYAAAPVCTPTRVAFMTGRYPARIPLGLKEPLVLRSEDSLVGLSPEPPSMAAYLKAAGYRTFLVGKWHLGFTAPFSPVKNGFDHFFGFHAGAVDYISHRSQGGGPVDLYENETPVDKEGYLTELLRDRAIEILQQPHQKPFFLAMMFSAPHWPWQAPGDKPYADTAAWTSGGAPAVYAAMMKSMDDAVGALMKALEVRGLDKHTVVIFTSDNGGERFSDMGGLKGKKMELWEGGIRVPAFVRWPGKIKANGTTGQVATTMDWTATILSLAGAAVRKDSPLDGTDLMPVLTGAQIEKDRTLYWRITQRNQHKAIREGPWKYLQDEKGAEYLFNLETDPSEINNLKEREPERFAALKNKYALWEKSVLAPIPLK